MKSKMNHSNAFVLEILLDILLFAILLTVALNMLIKAHHLTNRTRELHQAVSLCSDVADLYENGSGDFSKIVEVFPQARSTDSYLTIYFDQDFLPTDQSNAAYILTSTVVDSDQLEFAGSAIDISFADIDANDIYCLRACHFTGVTIKEFEETEGIVYVF